MTKKDFEIIANIIRVAGNRYDCADTFPATRSFIAKELADYLATTNPRFDREKFLTACGLSS